MHGLGLICTEGKLWESQRKFVNRYMRESGMAAVNDGGGSVDDGDDDEEEEVKRERKGGASSAAAETAARRMEARVARHVREFITGLSLLQKENCC